MNIKTQKIEALRSAVCTRLGEYRAAHVLSTENEAARIAEFILPETEEKARISALLHDITKEYDDKRQIEILKSAGISVNGIMMMTPQVFHGHTAAIIIPTEFPEFADDEIISAVDKHTTGSFEMSVLDCIIFLADFIEPTRRFANCIEVGKYFWDGAKKCNGYDEKLTHLYRTVLLATDRTVMSLISSGSAIVPDTLDARNGMILKLSGKMPPRKEF